MVPRKAYDPVLLWGSPQHQTNISLSPQSMAWNFLSYNMGIPWWILHCCLCLPQSGLTVPLGNTETMM